MPRVHTKTAAPAKSERICTECHLPIEPGQTYHSWSFRFGGKYVMHAECGYPRRSQLTQSKMGSLYDAIEDAEQQLKQWDGDDLETVKSIIEGVADAAGEVRDEYRDADEQFGGYGSTQSAERADELDYWVGDLESFYPDEFEEEDGLDEEATEDLRNQWKEEIENEAQSLLDGCPL